MNFDFELNLLNQAYELPGHMNRGPMGEMSLKLNKKWMLKQIPSLIQKPLWDEDKSRRQSPFSAPQMYNLLSNDLKTVLRYKSFNKQDQVSMNRLHSMC